MTRIQRINLQTVVCAVVCSTSGSSGTGDVVGPSSATADDIAVFSGTTGKLIADGGTTIAALQALISAKLSGARVTLPNDVTNNNSVANTIADVTGLEFAVTSGVTYAFRFVIAFTSQAAGNGSRWSLNGPAFTLLYFYEQVTTAAATIASSNALVAYDTPAAAFGTSAGTSGNFAVIEGVIRPSASGTLIARFASELSNNAIVALGGYSYVEYWTL